MNHIVGCGPLYGRPFGGTAILINNEHVSATVCLITRESFTAIKLYNWLIITVYMPCVGTVQRENLYRDILIELQVLMSDHPDCECLIGGDFNVDLDSNVSLSKTFNKFITDDDMSRCDLMFPVSDRNTYINEANAASSAIDYMLTTSCSEIIAFNVLDIDINLSDHKPKSNFVRVPASQIICTMHCYVNQVKIFGNVGNLSSAINLVILYR
jgi:hypothetical protein